MKKVLYGVAGAVTGILMILGLLYIKEKNYERSIGGQLVKVNYRFSKVFED
ncbi:MAG TPA: stress-responsive transcriptional regulator PspC [Eubacteriaceae bacterium]|jgi:hypothetical protein|nr:stress-responsive transcriptional regulator PspC [Eubacteriaceae bacterium]